MTAGRSTARKVAGRSLVYKAVVAIRNGVKAVINRRVSGSVKMSPAQKAALHKAQAKSHSGAALQKRKKSIRKRKSIKALYHPAHYIPKATDTQAKKNRMYISGAKAKAEYELGLRKAHPSFRG